MAKLQSIQPKDPIEAQLMMQKKLGTSAFGVPPSQEAQVQFATDTLPPKPTDLPPKVETWLNKTESSATPSAGVPGQ